MSVSLFQEIMISIQLPCTRRKMFLRAVITAFNTFIQTASFRICHFWRESNFLIPIPHQSPPALQGCFNNPRSHFPIPTIHASHSQERFPEEGRRALLMIEFLVWKSVLLLPSLIVPPICPGLCSGMSMTCGKNSEGSGNQGGVTVSGRL